MRLRAPFILWTSLGLELGRLILLTTSVVVLVLAFAAAVKPLADGQLEPLDTLRFMIVAVPPMLAYAMPFASGFATTLVYHRFVQDNEAIASFASGLSHRAVLAPAIVWAILLAMSLAALNEQVIPRFIRHMEQMIARDVARMLVRAVESGQALEMDGALIHADTVTILGPDPSVGAYERLLLGGIAAFEQDDEGGYNAEISASRAWIWLFEGSDAPLGEGEEHPEGGTILYMTMESFAGYRPGEMLGAQDRLRIGPWFVPGALRERPSFYTWGELRRLRHAPERINRIATLRRDLAYRLAEDNAIEALDDSLRETGRARLQDLSQQPVVVRGSGLTHRPHAGFWLIEPPTPDGRVEVELHRIGVDGEPMGGGIARWSVNNARLVARMDDDYRTPSLDFSLQMRGVRAADTFGETDATAQRAEMTLSGLSPVASPLRDMLTTPSAQLILKADERLEAHSNRHRLRAARDNLQMHIDRLENQVTSKQHERAAMALSCFVMVLTGAVTAMRLRNSLPLTVYLWSFFPALAAIISINGGHHLTGSIGPAGLPVLWGGVAALLLYTLIAYKGLTRH